MDAAKKLANKHNLQDLVPLNALSDARFSEVAQKIIVEEIKKGRYLFRKGDRDNQSIYVLDGKVSLIDGHRKVTGEVEAGTDISRYPVANQQPRSLSARAITKVVIARIDSGLLDVFLTWDQTSSTEVTEINAEDNEDWMTRMLQSEAFIKIPPAMIQRLLIKMQSYPASRGEVVIRQGDDGDFFYTIHKGTCEVTRTSGDGEEVKLAELSDGDCFGEESLVSDTRRNASVTMTSDGLLMRLAKKDFVELLQKPLVRHVGYEEAVGMIDNGAVWLDVRSPGEYGNGAFEDSVNIPLAELRGEMPELVYNAQYIICCDTGRRSASAAFILSHKGFEVYVLDGGMNGLPPQSTGNNAPQPEAGAAAEVLDLQVGQDAATDVQADAMTPAAVVQDQAEPGQLAELEALHSEIAGLRQQIEDHAGIEQQLAGSEETVSGLQQEVAQLKEQEGLLREQYAALQEEYDERLQLLGQELEQSQEASASLQAQTESNDHEKQCQLDQLERQQNDWQQRVSTLEEQLAGLARKYEDVVAERDSAREQLATLQTAADRSSLEQQEAQAAGSREIESLQAEIASLRSERQAVEEQAGSRIADGQETVSRLQAELESLGSHRDSLDRELQAERQRAAELQQQLEARGAGQESEAELLQEQNQQLQQSLDALQADIESLRSEKQAVEDQADSRIAEQQEVSSRLQAELDALGQHREELDAELEAERQRAVEQQQQFDAQLAEHRGQLEQSAEQADIARREVADLQQELEALRAEKRELEIGRDDGNERLGDSEAARQAAEEALQRQQQEWDGERAVLQEEIGGHKATITDLQEQLDGLREQASHERARLEEEISSRSDKAMKQVEQLEGRHVELKQERKQLQEELRLAVAGRDAVQQKLDSEIQQGAALQQEIESLNGRLSSLAAEAEAGIESLNGQLQAEQQHAAEAAQQLEEVAAGNEELRAKLAQQEETADQLRNEFESQARQLEATRLELQQAVEHSRSLELESEEVLRKAWDDLNRKNDTEKELQGQITRLRKKLEQSATDLQQVREEARESAAQARDALHAERKERSDERAQMAARQKELKEQLVAIAGQHEALQFSQKGALAQAESAARNDERARLKDVLETHAQAEDQLAVLRQELAQAREETERAVSEERQRNTTDLEFLRTRKAELDAVVAEQEVRLQELTGERDAAVSEHQSIRQQLSSLRAEVEVARGLINADGRGEVENPVKLRAELEEARRNLDIAIRVRSEAESARDSALAERDAMQRQLEDAGADVLPLSIPSLDEQHARAPVEVSSPATANSGMPAAAAGGSAGAVATAVPVPDRVRIRLWPAKAAGLGAVALALLASWFLLENRESIFPDTGALAAKVAGLLPKDAQKKDAGMAQPAAVPAAKGKTPEPVRPTVTAKPRPPAKPASPAVTAKPGPEPEPVKPVAVAAKSRPQPEPVKAAAATPEIMPVVAGRSFSDALKDGGRGPKMVELPSASFIMGSSDSLPYFTERPQHSVTLPAFAIGKYEVTFEEYDRFARATGRRLPNDEGWGRGKRPVINISWKDATAYVAWLSAQTGHHYGLPTEAQWEFAARAGTTMPHWWPESSEEIPANCFDCGSQWDGKMPAAVGSFSPNGLGLHDTSGNVQEWTQDCYHDSYTGAPSNGSAWQSDGCSQRVVRGGAYSSPLDSLRSARRAQFDQEARLDNLGFRVVRIK
jgi:formylglycine-generating enzyme required for sulfatase activity/CRP-like cAMP-binding protein/rhodanese-related sulfurtransferase/predicted  nucleic acid-binding Zn-ribbon protein